MAASSQAPIRIAAFGVGRMGSVHLQKIVDNVLEGRVQFVAIGDRHRPVLDKAVALLKDLGVDVEEGKKFATPEEMIAGFSEGGLDGVVVASRTSDHTRDTLPFVKAGVPVLVEKPLAGMISDACSFADAIGDSPTLVQLGMQRYHDPATQRAMEWVTKGLIGKVQQMHHVLQDKNPTPPSYESSGLVSDMSIHLVFEAIMFRNGVLPRYVQAMKFDAPHYVDAAKEGANVVHSFLTWDDGVPAHLWGSRLNNMGYDNGFKIIGTEGRIDVGEFVGDFGTVTAKLWRWKPEEGISRGTLVETYTQEMTPNHPKDPAPADFFPRFEKAYGAQLRCFVDCVRDKKPFPVTQVDGWKTIFVANAAEASGKRQGHRFDLQGIATAAGASAFAKKHDFD